MMFLQTMGDVKNLEQFRLSKEFEAELIGKTILLETRQKALLFPKPTVINHDNYPPDITFSFFMYGQVFNVTCRFIWIKEECVQVFSLIVLINRELSYFKRKRVEKLSEEAIKSYLGENYYGLKIQVIPKLAPLSKRESQKIEVTRQKVLKYIEENLKNHKK